MAAQSITSEEELVKKAQKNKESFGEIYSAYYERIFAYSMSYVHSREVAEDITSLVFEKALKGIDMFQWEGVSIKSWLYKIARNSINDHFRKKHHREEIISVQQPVSSECDTTIEETIENGEDSIEMQIIRSEEEETLFTILRYFSDKEQYLIYYKYFENMNNRDIAKLVNMSETNVGTKLQRLRKKIKTLLNNESISS